MKDRIVLTNKNINRYVKFMLKTTNDEFTEEELDKIIELTIDYNEENVDKINLNELLLFKNLTSLIIRNGFIDNEYFEVLLNLNKLQNVCFEKCNFENDIFIASLNIKELSIINCDIVDYSFVYVLNDLKKLTLINGTVDINVINKLKMLECLEISYSNVLNNNTELKLTNLKELYIDNTDIMDLSSLYNFNKLKDLKIDNNQFLKNKDIVNQLLQRNVNVFDEEMFEFAGDNDGL